MSKKICIDIKTTFISFAGSSGVIFMVMDVLRPPLIFVDGRCYRINEPESECFEKKQRGTEWDDYPSNYGS